jgi:hypothetical protein
MRYILPVIRSSPLAGLCYDMLPVEAMTLPGDMPEQTQGGRSTMQRKRSGDKVTYYQHLRNNQNLLNKP